jgi:inosine/xanthosine triphosphatase
MFIAVGSTNRIKVDAVKEKLKEYPTLSHLDVISYDVSSEISEQPMSLEEIIKGAKNRAKNAYIQANPCLASFGIESGLFQAPGSSTGYLEACICSVFDGQDHHIGLSCGFEVPPDILKWVLEDKKDLSQACFHSGITQNEKLGSSEGLIGILTKGRIDRKEYTKQCIATALIKLENAHLYQKK